MEVTKWYCDRCGQEFRAHCRLTPIHIKIGGARHRDFKIEEREFCDRCFPEVREQILSLLLRKETESDEE